MTSMVMQNRPLSASTSLITTTRPVAGQGAGQGAGQWVGKGEEGSRGMGRRVED